MSVYVCVRDVSACVHVFARARACVCMEARRPIRDGDEWEKKDRRVKPRNRRQPGRPRLLWTAARTTGC